MSHTKRTREGGRLLLMVASLAAGLLVLLTAGPERSLTLEIKDYAELPITGKLDGTGQSDGMLARMNSLREEPGGAKRFFINDINGPLYILDKATRNLTTYLDFNGREGHTGLFHKFVFETGWANGLLGLQFDPDYKRNGRFYTVHLEDPSLPGSAVPDNAHSGTGHPRIRDHSPDHDARHDSARRRAD